MLFSGCMVGLSHDKAPSLTPSMQDNSLPCHRQLRWRGIIAGFRPRTARGDSCGVSPPHGEVLLFRQKDPKPWAPGRGPSGAFAPVPFVWAAELASLKQSSPPYWIRDRGAAAPAGALGWRQGLARDECKRQRRIKKSARGWRYGRATEGGIRCRHYRRGGCCLSIPKGSWYHDTLSGILLQPCELHQDPFFITSSSLRSIRGITFSWPTSRRQVP